MLRAVMASLVMVFTAQMAQADPDQWAREWPNTDFSKTSIEFSEVLSGGPPKDGIPSIENPKFIPVAQQTELVPTEPVIGLEINGEARAYPLRVLTWHEIVNDTLGGVPVAVTYCPLCNAAIVFKRTLPDGTVTEFGTTGKLRKSDLIMYDRVTESWWQQFMGDAIAGELMGSVLETVPSRLESWEKFVARHPEGEVLVPTNPSQRPYGANPYTSYDTSYRPFLYRGDLPEGIEPLARVVVVDDQAWSLDVIQQAGTLEVEDLSISWEAGQNSALDTREIAQGRDVGNIIVQREGEDVFHHVTFAFVFHAFHPDQDIVKE